MTPSTNPSRQDTWRDRAIVMAGLDPMAFVPNKRWWFNGINPSSLRLTKDGAAWFLQQAKFKFHVIDLTVPIKGKHLLQLERLLNDPYYIPSHKKLFVSDEATAIMLQLHAGDLGRYLDNLQANQ